MSRRQTTVTLEKLKTMASDGSLTPTLQRRYFLPDATRSRAFDPVFTINPKAAGLFERRIASDEIVSLLRTAQAAEVERFKSAAKRTGKPIKILTEGDSWFKLPDFIGGYPKDVVDILDEDFDVWPLAMWKDTLENVAEHPTYRQPLGSGLYRHFLLSAGGNDILGSIHDYVLERKNGDTSPDDAASYIRPEFKAKVGGMMTLFGQIASDTQTIGRGSITLYVHGYGNAIPAQGRPACRGTVWNGSVSTRARWVLSRRPSSRRW